MAVVFVNVATRGGGACTWCIADFIHFFLGHVSKGFVVYEICSGWFSVFVNPTWNCLGGARCVERGAGRWLSALAATALLASVALVYNVLAGGAMRRSTRPPMCR